MLPSCRPMEGTLHDVVPDADPLPPLLFDQVTDVTPTLSDAMPDRDTLGLAALNDVLVVGAAIEIVGELKSELDPEVVTVHVKVTAAD